MPRIVPNFRTCVKVQISAHFGTYLVTDKADSKTSSTTVSAWRRTLRGVSTIFDESAIFFSVEWLASQLPAFMGPVKYGYDCPWLMIGPVPGRACLVD